MKKITIILFCVWYLVGATPIYAVVSRGGNQNAVANQGQDTTVQSQVSESEQKSNGNSTYGNQYQNQNMVQNQGEEQMVNSQEMEQEGNALDTSEDNSTGQNGKGNMNRSIVAEKVQELLDMEDRVGGIGKQIRVIAQNQNQSQKTVDVEVKKLEKRKGFMKMFFGPDYRALGNITKEMEQNQIRIRQLNQIKTQVSNEADVSTIRETVQAIIEENQQLGERITEENGSKSMFGWLFRYLNK